MKKTALFFLLLISSLLHADTPFDLSGIKSYYPVVRINSDKIDAKYKQILLNMIIKESEKLGINTNNFSSRSLAYLLSFTSVGDVIALKMDLLLGENAIRVDTKEEVFVVSYMSSRTFVVEELESDLIDNAEELLEAFTAQYKEDNL